MKKHNVTYDSFYTLDILKIVYNFYYTDEMLQTPR